MPHSPARALELLRLGTKNSAATFREGQEEAIRHVVDGRGRLLVVQATGWGKSSVYFIATKLLREEGTGPVLLISPLLALMRNQIAAAERMGVRAFTINSENKAEWEGVETELKRDAVDILLISPERLANQAFLAEVLGPVAGRISMLVVDEAHCISDWGHDFRPHYRLIERIARTLPGNLRLLATTATANNRVLADLRTVLGPNLTVSRGNLHRPSLLLQTMRMPKGGFGNLIALPLQHVPRTSGNSVFLSDNFQPHEDQWAFLASIHRMGVERIRTIVDEAERAGKIIGVRLSLSDGDEDEDPWLLPPSRKKKEEPIQQPLPARVRITFSNLGYVEKADLPSAMLNRLMRLAAFQNPEFYRAQAMRLSTFGKPRVIRCAEEFPRHLGLPRGCLQDAIELLQSHKIKVDLDDERSNGLPLDVSFHGELRPEQQRAVDTLLFHDTGILSATTAFGKTVVAAWMIAARKFNTLILVHRRQLLDQWRERLSVFLNLPIKSIGQIGGGRKKPTGLIDVAVIQSLSRKHVVDDLVAGYGQVIVDECHHLSAFSFEQVLRQVKARYVLGLTATPMRKDGHHPIILMQCGPIRYRVNARDQAASRPFEHVVIPRFTNFRLAAQAPKPEIHEIYAALTHDQARNNMIFKDLLEAIKRGRSPLVLTERTEHLKLLASRLENMVKNIIVLQGGKGVKQRKAIMSRLLNLPENEERVLMATGRYIGEGFDDARLDTLFLALPISWKGTVQQYVGRLHRLHDQKKEVVVYDYVDGCVPMLAAMFDKRQRGYESVGYSIAQNRLL